jgi:hypothetical protein
MCSGVNMYGLGGNGFIFPAGMSDSIRRPRFFTCRAHQRAPLHRPFSTYDRKCAVAQIRADDGGPALIDALWQPLKLLEPFGTKRPQPTQRRSLAGSDHGSWYGC